MEFNFPGIEAKKKFAENQEHVENSSAITPMRYDEKQAEADFLSLKEPIQKPLDPLNGSSTPISQCLIMELMT
jgi:hypothetical protein